MAGGLSASKATFKRLSAKTENGTCSCRPAARGAATTSCVTLVDYVEVVTETDATPWPEFLATSLSVPAFSVAERPGWRPIAAANLGAASRPNRDRTR